jgi:WXXGXW repeat (2 copies)
MAQGNIISLECRSCGGPVDLSVDGLFATCQYCGSKQMLQPTTSLFDRLKDFPNSTFHTRHIAPQLSSEVARDRLLDEIRNDPIGYKGVGALEVKVEGGFLPTWVIEAKIHCTWTGSNSEEYEVTLYRTVQKKRTVGNLTQYEDVQEPYTVTKTRWLKITGAHDFAHPFVRPANVALGGPATVMLALLAKDLSKSNAGLPPPLDGFSFVPATMTQREAWSDSLDCIAKWGAQECVGQAEQIDGVSPTLTNVDFSLVFAPFAIVSYTLNDRDYKHVYDLVEGAYCGDPVPLDHASVDFEGLRSSAREKRSAQSRIDTIILEGQVSIARATRTAMRMARIWAIVASADALGWLMTTEHTNVRSVFIGATVASGVALAYYWNRGKAAAKDAKQSIESTFPKEAPWKDFVSARRADLIHLARLACDTAATDTGKIESFGVFEDCCDYEARGERSRKLKELEGESGASSTQAEIIARSLLASGDVPPMLSDNPTGAGGAPRTAMSTNDRKLLALFCLLVAAAVSLAEWLDYRDRTPSASEISKAVLSGIGNSSFDVMSVTSESTETGPLQASVKFHAALRLRQPYYEKMDPDAYLVLHFPAERDTRGKIKAILAGRDAAPILGKAGLSDLRVDPMDSVTLIKVTTPAGVDGSLDGQMAGIRENQNWGFSNFETAVYSSNLTGQPRDKFSGDIIEIGSDKGDARMASLAQGETAILAKLENAQESYASEEKERQAAARGALVRSVAEGSIFKGAAVSQFQGSVSLEMVIDRFDSVSGAVDARVYGARADLSRKFTGGFRYDETTGKGVLKLATKSGDAIYAGGPIVNIIEGWELQFSVEGGHLEAQSSNGYWHYKFDRLSDLEAAQNKAVFAHSQSIANASEQEGTLGVAASAADSAPSQGSVPSSLTATMFAPSAPPYPKYEVVPFPPGRGYIWIKGHWSWTREKWEWIGGHWEYVSEPGSVLVPGRWTDANGRWSWTGGYYIAPVPNAPTRFGQPAEEIAPEAPPSLIRENIGGAPGRGYFWIPGHWRWSGGWVWFQGRFERYPGFHTGGGWSQGRWDRRGDEWVWTEGHWY